MNKRYKKLEKKYQKDNTEVWSALDTKDDQEVIIKILSIDDPGNRSIISELFKREEAALSLLKHPNIIKYLGSGVEENKFYIVTEEFSDDNLYAFVNNNSDLTYVKKLKIMISILDGLEEAHNRKIIHRDLKPSNILVDMFENIKIIDFGISKILDVTYSDTNTLKHMMTIKYAAPEQLLRRNVDRRSDYYSFGCIIYYLLSGKDPVEDKTQFLDTIKNMNVNNDLKKLMIKLLQFDIKDRTLTINDIKSVLNHEYIKNLSLKNKLYLKISNQIPKMLYSMGKIQQPNLDSAVKFISMDLEKSYIQKNKNMYYIVGQSLKYHCKLDSKNTHMVLGKIDSLEDDYNLKTNEIKRSMPLNAKWMVVKYMTEEVCMDSLNDILSLVNNEEKIKKANQQRKQGDQHLLNKWEKYLSDEDLIIKRKKTICRYNNVEYDEISGLLKVSLQKGSFKSLQLEKGDQIQLTSKNSNSQMTVGLLDTIHEDTVTINLKPNIDLNELSIQGNLGLDLIEAESSLKRLRAAIKTVISERAVNPNLMDIIRNPDLATINSISIQQNFIQDLDESNKTAVVKALSTKDLFLIQGPPGTGKTTVITEIVAKILEENPEAKILLCSQSHVAVDHALGNISNYIGNKKAIRIGRLEKISSESESLLITTQVNKWVADVKEASKNNFKEYIKSNFHKKDKEIEEILLKLNAFNEEEVEVEKSKQEERLGRITNITKEWHRRLSSLDEFDEIFAQNASIIAATCLGIASRHVLNGLVFDWVIIDEAARATSPELLVPLVRGKKLILVGDHRQLPPVISSSLEKYKDEDSTIKQSDLEKSLFEDLFERMPDDTKAILTSQFRMHPAIGQLINNVFYPSENIISKKTAIEKQHYISRWSKPIVWCNTYGMKDNLEQPIGISKRNETEARYISKILQEIEDDYKAINKQVTVSIISGYDAQRAILNNIIQPNDNQKWKYTKILINNVDAFQGSETDISIYSVVRNNPRGRIGFLNDARRLNVALSRGKTCLIIVGNANFVEKAEVIGRNPFVEIVNHIRNYSNDCIMEEIN